MNVGVNQRGTQGTVYTLSVNPTRKPYPAEALRDICPILWHARVGVPYRAGDILDQRTVYSQVCPYTIKTKHMPLVLTSVYRQIPRTAL